MSQKERHPLLSLLLLMILSLGGTILFTLLGMAIVIYGFEDLIYDFSLPPSWNKNETGMGLKILQIFSSLGMFVLPALLFAKMEGKSWINYLKLNTTSCLLVLLTALIMLVSMPILEWMTALNQKIELPPILKGIEQWMRNKEDITRAFVNKLLVMHTLNALWVNLLMIAILPAVGEELFFRGCLQRIFIRWIGNQHAGIWIVAFIFSAIHLQFFGFLPRMLLGALLGYLLFWGGSLYIPILAHFINNATVVVVSYVYQQQGLSMDQIDRIEPNGWYIYLFSFATVSILVWGFYKISLNQRKKN